MSDWDFLYDMHERGYSADEIADAAACGYNPCEWQPFYNDELSDLETEIDIELTIIFENITENAKLYHKLTGRYLQIWGELGELYAEITYGIKRHKPHTKGSDGKLGNDHIEIKTISPEKGDEQVLVKRAGNFNKLLIIKINEDFHFEGRFIERKKITKGEGKHARVLWQKLTPEDQ